MATSDKIAYWEPRVMSTLADGMWTDCAVHEVYFNAVHQPVAWTRDALSPRASSVQELRDRLRALLQQDNDEVACGDQGYTYPKTRVLEWLLSLDEAILDRDSGSPAGAG